MAELTKYVDLAKEYGMLNARIISPANIAFDIRTVLKCRWGCEDFFKQSVRCHDRNTTYAERVAMVARYQNILLIHAQDARAVSTALLKLERIAFLDGYYFAFALRTCDLCKDCSVKNGQPCVSPDRVRPCDQLFGIDVYKTANDLGLPCKVLQNRDDTPNRYGFLLID